MTPVEIVKSLYAAFARGDVPSVLNQLDAKIEWTEAEGFIYAGTYIGPEAVLSGVFMKMAMEWSDFKVAPAEFLDAGQTVVALGYYSGAYKATGKSMRAAFAHVWRLQDGKVVKFMQYADTRKIAEAY